MSIHIYCHKCPKYLGEIRDAKLRKGVKFDCGGHDKKETPIDNEIFNQFFGGVFDKNRKTSN